MGSDSTSWANFYIFYYRHYVYTIYHVYTIIGQWGDFVFWGHFAPFHYFNYCGDIGYDEIGCDECRTIHEIESDYITFSECQASQESCAAGAINNVDSETPVEPTGSQVVTSGARVSARRS